MTAKTTRKRRWDGGREGGHLGGTKNVHDLYVKYIVHTRTSVSHLIELKRVNKMGFH